jgi:two-component system OmpR family sensor kinase
VSLRARLIATLLALSAAALLVVGGITYASQRSFEEDRVNDQTRTAEPAVDHALSEAGVDAPGAGGFGPPDGERDDRFQRGPGEPGTEANLPPGTYGQRRAADGRVLGHVVLTYGQANMAPPGLPRQMTPGKLITVSARGDGDLRYRARATPSRGGAGLTIVAIPLNGVDERLNRLLVVEGLVIGGVLVLLALLSWFLVRAGLRPLERIGQTADAIAAGDLSRRVEVATPKTEVGRLGLALNSMLGRLEEAFRQREASEGRLRRFLADVSHELRTPLSSIRGYSEVFRIGAARDRADVDRAMTRIEEEAARMGVLVEDLLTLARLDEVRDREVEAVDLTQLAEDAAADARAIDSTRVIQAQGDGGVVVLGDPNQLRQVLGNLMRNALVHTPAGTPIELSTRRNGQRVELEVRDHGPGLPTDRPEELFERFWRAEPGRERGRAGAGLGLAIVAGIVRAHEGTVRAENAAGGGASFVVALPLAGSSRRRRASRRRDRP